MVPHVHPAVRTPGPTNYWLLPLGDLPFIDRPPGDGGFGTADYAIAVADDWDLSMEQYLELRDAMTGAVADVVDEFWLRWGQAKIEAT